MASSTRSTPTTWPSRSRARWPSARAPSTQAQCCSNRSSKRTSECLRKISAQSCPTSTAAAARSSAPNRTTATKRCAPRFRSTRCCGLRSTCARSHRDAGLSRRSSRTTTRCPRTWRRRSSKSSRRNTKQPANIRGVSAPSAHDVCVIHGGPRYLEFDWETTRLATQDAGHIVTIARNLVYRVVFIIPVLPHDRNNIERMETAMEVYDRFQPLKKAHPHRRLTADEARQAEPGLSPDVIGAVKMEEWGVDPHRLVYANVEDAIAP